VVEGVYSRIPARGPVSFANEHVRFVFVGWFSGTLRRNSPLAWIVLLLAIGSHLPQGLLKENIWNIQGLSGSPNFVGISGVIMGLFGYIAMKTYLRPELGFSLSPQSFFMVGIILVLGFAGDIAGSVGNLHMANFAHLGGLLSGLLLGWLMSVNANNRIASR